MDTHLPNKPIIPSQLSAEKEVFKFNNKKKLEVFDLDGLIWKLDYKRSQKQDPNDLKKLLWIITMSLSATATSEDLVKTKILELDKDERLLQIIDAIGTIQFKIPPVVISHNAESSAFKIANKILPDYLNKVNKKPLKNFKIKILYQYIDDFFEFK